MYVPSFPPDISHISTAQPQTQPLIPTQFDNDNGIPVVAAAPINIYQDILWNGMSLVQTPGTTGTPGVQSNSPPNYAAYSALDLATVEQGQPSMRVNYADSTIDHFDLKSFYYGCVVASQVSLLGIPTACTITVTAYSDADGANQVATQSFNYKAGALTTQMQLATLGKGFTGVKKIDFDVSNDLLTAALIDTVSYVVYSTGKITN